VAVRIFLRRARARLTVGDYFVMLVDPIVTIEEAEDMRDRVLRRYRELDSWKINIPAITAAVTGHRMVYTYGKV
jgi:hypothetical protein